MGESFKLATGIVAAHVPLGVKELMQAVISGRVTFWFAPFSAGQQPLRDGTFVPLGVSTARRFALLPDVPTLMESGVSGFDQKAWYGIWAPAATPRQVVGKLATDISRALAADDMRDTFAKKGYEPFTMTQAEFEKFVLSEIEFAARTMKAIGHAPK